MTQSYSRSSQLNSTVGSIIREEDQAFSDVIAAISEGKYSWACVLMLRSAGYNPLHYMPYRTYNRIIKANLNLGKKQKKKTETQPEAAPIERASAYQAQSSLSHAQPSRTAQLSANHTGHRNSLPASPPPSSDCKIADLSHLDAASESSRNTIKGGWSNAASDISNWWSSLMGGH